MTYEFNLIYALWALGGFLAGLVIGRAIWRRAAPARVADSSANVAALAAARSEADRRAQELATAQASIRPLADDVDRLKRDLARAQRPQIPLPLTNEVRASVTNAEVEPLATLVEGAMAGTGPIVIGDAAADFGVRQAQAAGGTTASRPGPVTSGDAAVPGIRQLKGVGDKLAAALDAVGLSSLDKLARLNTDEALDADTRLGVFNGRIAKDRLVEQAVLLDEGRTTEYETRFGRIGGPVMI